MKNITKNFPGVKALDDVTMEVKKGEIHALLGENGAGKSTLIKILAGAFKADEGEIILDGQKIEINNPWEAQDMGIIVMHQEINAIPALDVSTNISLGKEVEKGGHLDQATMHKKAKEHLESLGFDIDTHALMRDLSFAQMQMVEIARAVSKDPKLVVMDEPTASLTNKEKEQLYRVIKILKDKGVSIIYITHLLDEVFAFADRVTVLRDGKWIGTENVSDMTFDKLIQMMVGRKIEHHDRKSVYTDEVVLEVKNIVREGVLHNLSFNLRKGEILGFAGLAGAGRTELARAVYGADHKDSGTVIMNGKEITINSPSDALDHSIGLVPEERKTQGLMMLMPLRENINMSSLDNIIKFGHISYKKMTEKAVEFIDKLKVHPHYYDRLVSKLSGGNQQKVVVARSMCKDTQILIIDEPTRGMDVGAKEEIYAILQQMAEDGKSIIMISSEMPELLRMSDRILVMRDGNITGEFSREEATQEKILSCAMGGMI